MSCPIPNCGGCDACEECSLPMCIHNDGECSSARSIVVAYWHAGDNCRDCGRPFDMTTLRHLPDLMVNRFLIPSCCVDDYRAANPNWKATR